MRSLVVAVGTLKSAFNICCMPTFCDLFVLLSVYFVYVFTVAQFSVACLFVINST